MNAAYIRQLAYRYQAVDWGLALVLAIVTLFMNFSAHPHCRPFEWNDASINYQRKPDTFPVYMLFLAAVVVPIFYIVFSHACVGPLQKILGEPLSLLAPDARDVDVTVTSPSGSTPRSMSGAAAGPTAAYGADGRGRLVDPVRVRALRCGTGPVYPWVKAHCWALALEFFTVDMMKLYAGRLRPDFLERMREKGFTESSTRGHDPRTDMAFFCPLMEEHRSIREGRLSFPSGHSAMSTAVFTITTFYFMAHLRPFARQGSFARLLVSLSPMLLPIFCAVSRTRDNKHNFSDIAAGAFIGITAALLTLALTFRQTGGPLAIYLARTEADIEYVKQLLLASGGTGSVAVLSSGGGGTLEYRNGTGGLLQRRATGGDYQTTSGSSGAEMRAMSPTTLDDGATIAVPIGASGSGSGPPSMVGSTGGSGSRVVVVTTVGERELNEDPAAVPWL